MRKHAMATIISSQFDLTITQAHAINDLQQLPWITMYIYTLPSFVSFMHRCTGALFMLSLCVCHVPSRSVTLVVQMCCNPLASYKNIVLQLAIKIAQSGSQSPWSSCPFQESYAKSLTYTSLHLASVQRDLLEQYNIIIGSLQHNDD